MLSVKYFLSPADREINMEGFPLIYDKDVKIYENKSALPRAYVVHKLSHTSTKGGALEMIAADGFDARMEAVIDGEAPTYLSIGIEALSAGEAGVEAKITSFDFNRVEIEANPAANGLLIFTDAWYPGWSAYVDGEKTPVLRVNSIVRGVALSKGAHTVVFKYCPRSFTLAMILFGLSLIAVIVLIVKDKSAIERT
jgi:uncharacterized membrane protein YfhO